MTKLFLLGFLLIFVSMQLFAQSAVNDSVTARHNLELKTKSHDEQSPDVRAKAAADKITEIAQLSPDQYAKVLDLIREYRTANPTGDIKDQKEAMDNKIKAILTDSQWKLLKKSNINAK